MKRITKFGEMFLAIYKHNIYYTHRKETREIQSYFWYGDKNNRGMSVPIITMRNTIAESIKNYNHD